MSIPVTIAGHRSDAEILVDFVRALALRELLDELHDTAQYSTSDALRDQSGAADDLRPH